jgi:polyphenol oxidase
VLPDPFYDHDGQIAIDLPDARAVFTTRSWGDVRETGSKIAERLGLELAFATQVHGTGLITVTPSTDEHKAALTEADAIVTTAGGVAPTVLTADCVPIVIAARGAVAAVHAGWRGLDAGIIAEAAARVRALSGGVLNAAIGPAAGPCCYEVGDDLHRRFALRSQDFRRRQNLDLKAIARVQLMEAGVARVHDTGLCTICSDRELLFSYRRDGAATGRQAAIAWLS